MPCNCLPDKVVQFSRQFIFPGSSVVVGVSGGSDSVALLFLLSELKEQLSVPELLVAHLNHGLRGEDSDGDELLVREYAAQLGLRFFSKRLSGYRIGEAGLEAAVRKERYRYFDEVRKASGCRLIATGHTLDDQAETVLMRIMRGSGLAGLRGIAPSREDSVVRPLLSVRRLELVEWLQERDIPYRTDRSNDDLRFLRNRIRHQLLPQLESWQPGVSGRLAALAEEARMEWGVQQQRVAQWLKKYLVSLSDGSVSVERAGLEERALAAEGLRMSFIQWGITPSRYHITSVFENGSREGGGIFLLPGGWRYRYCRNSLIFEKGVPVFNYPIAVPGFCENPMEGRRLSITLETSPPEYLDCGKWTVYIDGKELDDCCTYRTVAPNDTFIPFGTKREVKVLQFLAKQGVPRPQRDRTGCVITGGNKIVWVPGIRMDERFRITSATKKVIKLQYESIL